GASGTRNFTLLLSTFSYFDDVVSVQSPLKLRRMSTTTGMSFEFCTSISQVFLVVQPLTLRLFANWTSVFCQSMSTGFTETSRSFPSSSSTNSLIGMYFTAVRPTKEEH